MQIFPNPRHSPIWYVDKDRYVKRERLERQDFLIQQVSAILHALIKVCRYNLFWASHLLS